MALKRSELYSLSAVTITTTEYSIPNAGTPSAKTTPAAIQVMVDPVANLADGDEFMLRVYEKTVSGGTQKCVHSCLIRNAQAALWMFPDEAGLMVLNGWDVTLQKISGTDRAISGRVEATTGSNVVELYGRSNVTLGTEYGIVAGSTTLATSTIPALIQAIVYDRGNMVKGDEFEIRVAEAGVTGGTKRTLWTTRIHDVQVCPAVTPWIPARDGYEVSVKKISATDRAFDMSIRALV